MIFLYQEVLYMFEEKLICHLSFHDTLNDAKGRVKPIKMSGVEFLDGNKGIKFNSFGSSIDFPYSVNLARQEFTLEAWIKPVNISWQDEWGKGHGGYVIVHYDSNIEDWANTSAFILKWSQTEKKFTFISGKGESNIISTRDTFDEGAVYQVVVTKDINHFVLYVNGQEQGRCLQFILAIIH
jgi:hypothetical protein